MTIDWWAWKQPSIKESVTAHRYMLFSFKNVEALNNMPKFRFRRSL